MKGIEPVSKPIRGPCQCLRLMLTLSTLRLVVIGPHAAALGENLRHRPDAALDILVGGFVFQGIGFMLSLMIYAAFIYRLMTEKLPQEHLRPGMFVSVGPSGFTISGIVSIGHVLPDVVFSSTFMGNGELAGQVSKIVSIWAGLWLWGLAFWFFLVSVGAHWSCLHRGTMTFAMTFYSYVFPNTALTTATFAIAKALDNRPINIIGCVMTVFVIITWLAVFVGMIRAVINKDILWPQKQEDREEGGWKEQPSESVVGQLRRYSTQEGMRLRLRRENSQAPSSTVVATAVVHAGGNEDTGRQTDSESRELVPEPTQDSEVGLPTGFV